MEPNKRGLHPLLSPSPRRHGREGMERVHSRIGGGTVGGTLAGGASRSPAAPTGMRWPHAGPRATRSSLPGEREGPEVGLVCAFERAADGARREVVERPLEFHDDDGGVGARAGRDADAMCCLCKYLDKVGGEHIYLIKDSESTQNLALLGV